MSKSKFISSMLVKKISLLVLLTSSAFAFSGPAHHRVGLGKSKVGSEKVISNPRLAELHKITKSIDFAAGENGISETRTQAIKQAAFSWGVQEGLYWRYGVITKLMHDNSLLLHTAFGFDKFVYEGKLLLPTVQKAERVYNQISDKSTRTYDVSISLDRPAKIVSQIPTWREYLIRAVDEPRAPHDAMFPRTPDELVAWNFELNRGWNEGVQQANDIHDMDVTILRKEIVGLYLFRKLMAMNYFTLPKISSSRYGNILFDNGKTINLNDTVYTITVESNFMDVEDWEPFFRVNNSRMELH